MFFVYTQTRCSLTCHRRTCILRGCPSGRSLPLRCSEVFRDGRQAPYCRLELNKFCWIFCIFRLFSFFFYYPMSSSWGTPARFCKRGNRCNWTPSKWRWLQWLRFRQQRLWFQLNMLNSLLTDLFLFYLIFTSRSHIEEDVACYLANLVVLSVDVDGIHNDFDHLRLQLLSNGIVGYKKWIESNWIELKSNENLYFRFYGQTSSSRTRRIRSRKWRGHQCA